MGGVKRKISIEKIEKKGYRAVAFSKRLKGLYSKATDLCLMSDSQIAIIATPVSSQSHVSFFSFGHSSVDTLVAAFLSNQPPQVDSRLGFWWEDEKLAQSDDSEVLSAAITSMSTMLSTLKNLQKDRSDDMKMKKSVVHGTDYINETLNLPSSEVVEGGELILYNDSNGAVPRLSDFDEHNLDWDSIIDYDTNSENVLKILDMDGDEFEGIGALGPASGGAGPKIEVV